MVCIADTRVILVQAKMSLRLVDSATTRVALHRSARSRGYKLSREGADARSLGRCVCLSASTVRCLSSFPFIVPKGRTRVTFVVRR
jgi:hypothetical protein